MSKASMKSKAGKIRSEAIAEATEAALNDFEGNPVTTADNDGLLRSIVIDKTTKARSVVELLDLLGLPRDTADPFADSDWRVEEYRCNPSDVSLNLKAVGKVLRVTNYHQRLVVRHRKLKPIEIGMPQPLVLTAPASMPKRKIRQPEPGRIERSFIFPDTQFGFYRTHNSDRLHRMHDLSAISVAFQIMEKYGPTGAVSLGDLLDLPMFQGKFPRGPELGLLTSPALNECAFFLWKIRQILDKWRDKRKETESYPAEIIPGNHDERLAKMMIDAANEASWLRPVNDPDGPPMLSIPRLIDTDAWDVKWLDRYPDGYMIWNSNVWAKHGDTVRPNSGGTVSAELKKVMLASVIFGHIHRDEVAWITSHGPLPTGGFGQRERMAASPGCLCRIDGAVPAQHKRNNWQQSVATLEYEIGGREYFAYHSHRIQAGRTIYDGEIIEADVDSLTEEMVEWIKKIGWKNYDLHHRALNE